MKEISLNANDHGEFQYSLDPKDFGLPDDFIFIDRQWGSMFYKHIGYHTQPEAKRLCSAYGDTVHLPIPRSQEENEFYHTWNFAFLGHQQVLILTGWVVMTMRTISVLTFA